MLLIRIGWYYFLLGRDLFWFGTEPEGSPLLYGIVLTPCAQPSSVPPEEPTCSAGCLYSGQAGTPTSSVMHNCSTTVLLSAPQQALSPRPAGPRLGRAQPSPWLRTHTIKPHANFYLGILHSSLSSGTRSCKLQLLQQPRTPSASSSQLSPCSAGVPPPCATAHRNPGSEWNSRRVFPKPQDPGDATPPNS